MKDRAVHGWGCSIGEVVCREAQRSELMDRSCPGSNLHPGLHLTSLVAIVISGLYQ